MSELETLAQQIHACRKCSLGSIRTHAVPGEGPGDAQIMFIGEAPGFHEDRQGRPFVGASGNLLEELLASIGLSRDQVYIANVIKCRPPGNRDPKEEEIGACGPYLDRQIELIRPRIIVTLGRFSMQRYFPGQSITRIHGQVKKVGNRAYVPMFHPAAALRNPKWMDAIREDFAKLPDLLAQLDQESGEDDARDTPPQDPQQLSLF